MTNSADPDQMALQKPADLDLHCLQSQGISGSARLGLTVMYLLYARLKNGMYYVTGYGVRPSINFFVSG